jgi:hypothetical protein
MSEEFDPIKFVAGVSQEILAMRAQLDQANKLLRQLGDAVADTIEQAIKQDWVDGHNHLVLHNKEFHSLIEPLHKTSAYFEKYGISKKDE